MPKIKTTGEEGKMQVILQKLQDTFPAPARHYKNELPEIKNFHTEVAKRKENQRDLQKFKELVEQVNEAIKKYSLQLKWDKIGDVVVVRVINTITGEEMKVFPPEQVARYIDHLSTFIEVYMSLFVDKKI